MRISNNNINEEEKEYWAQWGKKIFEYSFHRGTHDIPPKILEDYLAARKRNFEVNKTYLDWDFETLVFSKDDCAEQGFNVEEARELEALGGFVKTGADEIPLTLLARAIVNTPVKIAPVFLEPEHKHLISNYEDVSIEQSVKGQIELAGCAVCEPQEADLLLYVNNFVDRQGELVMGVDTAPFSGEWKTPDRPYMIADVRFANGADNAFVEKLFAPHPQTPSPKGRGSHSGLGENFYGYCAWNTSANTLGSSICAAVVKFIAKDYDDRAFKRLQLVRFLDDWAYQANVREEAKTPRCEEAKLLMFPYENKVFELLGIREKISYTYPWNRKFEIEVKIEQS
jgi:hypothetical protein